MVREIVRNESFLSLPSENASKSDYSVVIDLVDTLRANASVCVGMAANMIGIRKRIIAVAAGPIVLAMINPVITKRSGEYKTEEGCLSLEGMRECIRYERIEVEYLDEKWKKQKVKYTGFTSEIIQHEIDHLDGILI